MRRKYLPRGDDDAAWHDAGDPHGLAFTAPRLLPATVAPPPPQADAPSACAHCSACTRFGNCGDPVGAGLADSFRLMAHPAGGLGCKAYVPSNVQDGVSYWRVYLPEAVSDLALCPPVSARVVRGLHPQALRIEPIAPGEAWPA